MLCLLLGEVRAEGFTRLDPLSLGRLIGLDRASEVKDHAGWRSSRSNSAPTSCCAVWPEAHLASHTGACGLLYVDGHLRAYHGTARAQKTHLARQRLAAPASMDTWICGRTRRRRPRVVLGAGAGLTGELK